MPFHPRRSPKSRPNSAPLTENQALSYALRLLKTRPRTCFEVAARLQERGVPGFQIDSVLQQLTVLHLLDDARFTREWVRWRDRTRPSGAQLLRHELDEKGVEAELIQAIIAERETVEWREEIGVEDQSTPIDEVLATQLIAHRSARLEDLPRDKRQRRILDLLARRGFSYAIAQKLARTSP